MKLPLLLFPFLILFQLPAPALENFSKSSFGPRIECNAKMIDLMKKRIMSKEEPFWSYWKGCQKDIETALKTQAKPYQGDHCLSFHGAAQDQGTAARLLAYHWLIDGDLKSGSHAINLLNRWASVSPQPGTEFNPKIRFPNAGMDVARGMLPFIVAYDLLGSHPELTQEKKIKIESWFRQLVKVVKEGIQRWEKHNDFGNQEFQNHHASHVLGLVLFGAALRDEKLIQFAVDSKDNPKDFKELIAGLILMPGDKPHGGLRGKPLHAGELQDRYRTNEGSGLTYCHLTLTLLLYTADVLNRVTGKDWVNWKAPTGECLKLSATFYSDFFRLRNARLHGDYYFRDQRTIQNNLPFLGLFEVALHHWPEVPNLKAIVRSMNRAKTQRSWLCYYGLPLLTHGVQKP